MTVDRRLVIDSGTALVERHEIIELSVNHAHYTGVTTTIRPQNEHPFTYCEFRRFFAHSRPPEVVGDQRGNGGRVTGIPTDALHRLTANADFLGHLGD